MASKSLVAVFSAGGVTKKVGQAIAKVSGADFYEIIPKTPYSSADLDWTNKKSRSTLEMNDPESRPELADHALNIEAYDTVILGYPIWWGVAPRIIETFLESYDFSGKTIIPFCTSGGSGLGRSDIALHDNAGAGVTWVKGRQINRPNEAEIQRLLEAVK